jgi:hypothetical protein
MEIECVNLNDLLDADELVELGTEEVEGSRATRVFYLEWFNEEWCFSTYLRTENGDEDFEEELLATSNRDDAIDMLRELVGLYN